jgi:hypothetical protein
MPDARMRDFEQMVVAPAVEGEGGDGDGDGEAVPKDSTTVAAEATAAETSSSSPSSSSPAADLATSSSLGNASSSSSGNATPTGSTPGTLYVLRYADSDYYKIGRTTRTTAEDRVRGLESGTPQKFRVLREFALRRELLAKAESFAQKSLAHLRGGDSSILATTTGGTEFFHCREGPESFVGLVAGALQNFAEIVARAAALRQVRRRRPLALVRRLRAKTPPPLHHHHRHHNRNGGQGHGPGHGRGDDDGGASSSSSVVRLEDLENGALLVGALGRRRQLNAEIGRAKIERGLLDESLKSMMTRMTRMTSEDTTRGEAAATTVVILGADDVRLVSHAVERRVHFDLARFSAEHPRLAKRYSTLRERRVLRTRP